MIPQIVIGFILLDAIALWACIYARGPRAVKLAAIVLVLAFNFVTWRALDSYSGYPTSTTPPADVIFVKAIVHEPVPYAHDPGVIYLWAIPTRSAHTLLGYAPSGDTPRAYRLPYSEALYAAVNAAEKASAHGEQTVISHGKRHGHQGHGHSSSLRDQWHAYKLPPTALPRKNP